MPTRQPTQAPRRKRASVSDAESNKAAHEGEWEEVSEPIEDDASWLDMEGETRRLNERLARLHPPAEMTVVPAEFSRMPDGVLAVAMARYQDVLASGRAEVHAVTEGVIAAKLYAREHKLPYRKEE